MKQQGVSQTKGWAAQRQTQTQRGRQRKRGTDTHAHNPTHTPSHSSSPFHSHTQTHIITHTHRASLAPAQHNSRSSRGSCTFPGALSALLRSSPAGSSAWTRAPQSARLPVVASGCHSKHINTMMRQHRDAYHLGKSARETSASMQTKNCNPPPTHTHIRTHSRTLADTCTDTDLLLVLFDGGKNFLNRALHQHATNQSKALAIPRSFAQGLLNNPLCCLRVGRRERGTTNSCLVSVGVSCLCNDCLGGACKLVVAYLCSSTSPVSSAIFWLSSI